MKTRKGGERLDKADRQACLETYAPPLKRCAGNRLIVDGYVCLHCGSDSPETDCKEPARA